MGHWIVSIRFIEKFKKYYLPWLIGGGGLIALQFATGLFEEEKRQRVLNVDTLVIFVGLVLFLTLFCGGLYHYFFEVYRPKRLVKLFNRIRVLDLSEFGLTLNESEKNFSGEYKGYSLTLFADSSVSDGDWLKTNAFIIPKETQHEIYKRFLKNRKFEFNNDNDLFCLTVKTNMRFGKSPDIQRLRKDINELVDALRFERIEPKVLK